MRNNSCRIEHWSLAVSAEGLGIWFISNERAGYSVPKIGEWESKDFKARVQLDSSCTHFLQSNYVELGLETLLRSFALARLPRSKVEVLTAGSKCPGLRDPVGCHRKMSQDSFQTSFSGNNRKPLSRSSRLVFVVFWSKRWRVPETSHDALCWSVRHSDQVRMSALLFSY